MNKEELEQINGGINLYSMAKILVGLVYLVKSLRKTLVR